MTVRSATLSSGIISTPGYSVLLESPAGMTALVKGFSATNMDAATHTLTLYLWGPAGGAGLQVRLGSVDLGQYVPYNLTLWLPLNPGFRIGYACNSPSVHFALFGSILYGVADVPADAFPDFMGETLEAVFSP
jgi:hypothetical protein